MVTQVSDKGTGVLEAPREAKELHFYPAVRPKVFNTHYL